LKVKLRLGLGPCCSLIVLPNEQSRTDMLKKGIEGLVCKLTFYKLGILFEKLV